MRHSYLLRIPTLIGLCCAAPAHAQQPQSANAVPRVVRLNGSFHQVSSPAARSIESVTLAVYREDTGGAPLWQEVQNAEVDSEGRYSLLMGSTLNEGVPVDLFRSGEPRWLGVRVNRPGEVEQPRVLMVSVPYALKASDAETLGGRPASAYLLANAAASTPNSPTTVMNTASPDVVKPRVSSGAPGFIGVFTNSTDLGNSVMRQANGSIGVGTIPGLNASTVPSLDLRTTPFSQIGMGQTTDYLTFFASDQFGPAIYWNPAKDLRFGKGGAGLYNAFGFTEQMRIQSSTGNVGIGTQSPASKLDVAGDINLTGAIAVNGNRAIQFGDPNNGTTAVGLLSVNPASTGTANTNVGYSSLASNTMGDHNVALGYFALWSNTIGQGNVALGADALGSITTGSANIGVGGAALLGVETGSNNIAIGDHAGVNLSIGVSNNIDIGNHGLSGDSNAIRIGTPGTHAGFFAAGVRGFTTNFSNAVPLLIDSAGQLGTANSSRRFKEDIEDMGLASHDLLRLRPVTYRYKQPYADGSKPIDYGLIAEEVAEIYPDLVAHSADGQIETVQYQKLTPMMLNEMQRQAEKIALLQQSLDEQRQRNDSLQERLAKLESLLIPR